MSRTQKSKKLLSPKAGYSQQTSPLPLQ